ncbi:hypothetical protein [Lactiplantibacillus plantarum]|uniref:hypothetical protein n=1 Tax=Lactiplantibacillus plantarum TaxID=1590 RepID=UPI00214C3589|nr:hypothetical protein [Lactiplantibacillus plantarum]
MQKSTVTKLKQALIATGNLKDYGTSTVTLALSVSDHRHRAQVRFYRCDSFKQAWIAVAQQLAKTPQASLDSSCTTISQNPSSELGSIRSSSINTEVTKRNF